MSVSISTLSALLEAVGVEDPAGGNLLDGWTGHCPRCDAPMYVYSTIDESSVVRLYCNGRCPEDGLRARLDFDPATIALDLAAMPSDLAADMWGRQQPAPSVAARSVSSFFTRDGLALTALVRAVLAEGDIASGPGERLYWYCDGLWREDGATEVRRRTYALLGDRARWQHAREAVAFLSCQRPRYTEENLSTEHLNLPNGLLNWRTGELRPHTPEMVVTPRLPIAYDPNAECPRIRAWLAEVVGEDAVDFALEVMGYCLLNDQPLHKAVLLYGTGRNGKGTFLRLLTALLGKDNVTGVTPQRLDENRFAAAQLHGKLANLIGDVDPRMFKATETFKQVTGGDMLTAEHKHGQPFTFTCRATIVAAFNELPRTADATDGFFSRWLVVPFVRSFTGREDRSLDDKLQSDEEMRGLLRYAVEGLRRLMARGNFDEPESVREATRSFREVADPVRAWLAEWEPTSQWLTRPSVYQDFTEWALANGYFRMGSRKFYGRIESVSTEPGSAVRLSPVKRQSWGYLIERHERHEGPSELTHNLRAEEKVEIPAVPAVPAVPMTGPSLADVLGDDPLTPAQGERRRAWDRGEHI